MRRLVLDRRRLIKKKCGAERGGGGGENQREREHRDQAEEKRRWTAQTTPDANAYDAALRQVRGDAERATPSAALGVVGGKHEVGCAGRQSIPGLWLYHSTTRCGIDSARARYLAAAGE